ncbi:MAG TPA: radical SAM family heme chaperone HemW [Gemmatimonadaceae bacterium]|nr:radical SAM family heme chaperone HemW [Gemmatimonadaceae bacterium]
MTVRHVYVHVPFCARRCSYCDFSIAVRKSTPVDEYLAALQSELAGAQRSEVDTIYFGGGTPSRLGGEGVASMLDLVRSRYTPLADAEITLEANPEDVSAEAAAAWLRAGVNRLSIGSQSFDDGVLTWMHRTHPAAAIAPAVRMARDAGFTNVSLDLIFSLPESLNRDWARDLDAAVALEPEHISLYGLTVEPATPLARWLERGTVAEAPEERYEREYLLADEWLTGAGFDHYEVSNFSRPGRASRHNAAYWELVPYVGHGPSAHSFDGSTRSWNVSAYREWIDQARRGAGVTAGSEVLTPEQHELERAYLGLRTTRGCELEEVEPFGVEPWLASGWAALAGSRLRLLPAGWLRLDALAAALTVHRSPCNV